MGVHFTNGNPARPENKFGEINVMFRYSRRREFFKYASNYN